MPVRAGKTTDIGVGQMRVFRGDGTKVSVANVDGSFYAWIVEIQDDDLAVRSPT